MKNWPRGPRLAHQATVDDNYRDVDLYLTMALVLLDGNRHESIFGQDAMVTKLLKTLDTLEMPAPDSGPFVELYGGRRSLDASQFKPRGHYTKSETLKRYFRAMMWLGPRRQRIQRTACRSQHESHGQ